MDNTILELTSFVVCVCMCVRDKFLPTVLLAMEFYNQLFSNAIKGLFSCLNNYQFQKHFVSFILSLNLAKKMVKRKKTTFTPLLCKRKIKFINSYLRPGTKKLLSFSLASTQQINRQSKQNPHLNQ